jgi:hypothetical protein
LRSKTQAKWSGPFAVEEKLTPTTWRVNGKPEHGYNLKRAIIRPAGGRMSSDMDDQGGDADRPKRGRDEECVSGRKRQRLTVLLACMPRGDLLWLA